MIKFYYIFSDAKSNNAVLCTAAYSTIYGAYGLQNIQ